MKGLKPIGAGLAVLALLVAVPVAALAVVLAVGHDSKTTTVSVSMPHMTNGGMGGMMAQTQPATTAAADQLTIIHVQKGCHVWSNGTAHMATMRLTMDAGQMLRIVNQDLDMHRMTEVSGPAMMLGGAMKEGQAQTLTFTKPGIYKFGTKVLPMKGMPDVATIGPDNNLRLTVTVA